MNAVESVGDSSVVKMSFSQERSVKANGLSPAEVVSTKSLIVSGAPCISSALTNWLTVLLLLCAKHGNCQTARARKQNGNARFELSWNLSLEKFLFFESISFICVCFLTLGRLPDAPGRQGLKNSVKGL